MSYNARSIDDPLGGDSLSGSQKAQDGGPDWNLEQGNVRGVYAPHPAMTPKYHTGYSTGGAQDKSLQKMARMYIAIPDNKNVVARYNKSVRGIAKRYSDVMAIGGSGAFKGNGYIDFFLTQAQESLAENAQIAQVLGDNYVAYMYGRTPATFRYDGVLLNTVQNDWRIAMWVIYENLIRGTKLARNKVSVTLAYDSVAVTGSILNMTEILRADNETAVPFSFTMLVSRFDILKQPLFGPTNTQPFVYELNPDTFANVVVDEAKVSRRSVATPGAATSNRAGSTEENAAADEEENITMAGDVYNKVGAKQLGDQLAINTMYTLAGPFDQDVYNSVAASLNEPAS